MGFWSFLLVTFLPPLCHPLANNSVQGQFFVDISRRPAAKLVVCQQSFDGWRRGDTCTWATLAPFDESFDRLTRDLRASSALSRDPGAHLPWRKE